MCQYNYSGDIYHYGVKGMKWGRRKARETTTYDSIQKKKQAMDDAAANVAAAKVRKKAAQKEAVEYTLTLLNEMNDTHLSKSQLKRAKNRIALIEFVNAVCDQKFTTYAETMRFIKTHNKDEMMKIAA